MWRVLLPRFCVHFCASCGLLRICMRSAAHRRRSGSVPKFGRILCALCPGSRQAIRCGAPAACVAARCGLSGSAPAKCSGCCSGSPVRICVRPVGCSGSVCAGSVCAGSAADRFRFQHSRCGLSGSCPGSVPRSAVWLLRCCQSNLLTSFATSSRSMLLCWRYILSISLMLILLCFGCVPLVCCAALSALSSLSRCIQSRKVSLCGS